MLRSLKPFIAITRPGNALMAAVGVALGWWLTGTSLPLYNLALMIAAAAIALSYGNVINDIIDAEGDRINHSKRPIPSGEMTKRTAGLFAGLLIVMATACGFFVSPIVGIATLIPLVLLTIYSLFLKGTPLAGNCIVSILVAYTLLYGAIPSGNFSILIIPAILAFLLNTIREIVKDMQDEVGDRAAGVVTTAVLPKTTVRTILLTIAILYAGLVLVPYWQRHFDFIYASICVAIIIPLHLFIMKIIWLDKKCCEGRRLSKLIKIEMLAGLGALAIDNLVMTYAMAELFKSMADL